ncbi:MAG TPA: 3-dehydroquinate synthase [Polyangiales bacterium]|jgi:3-dehydroquinate synthase|nr:3-dehydroquinate synthase [Polyangiales bacterium]
MSSIVQRFAVQYEYPVHFTRDLFRAGQADLATALTRREPTRRARCFFAVEARVAELWPQLLRDIQGYVAAHSDSLLSTAPPYVATGGEACKNDDSAVPRLLAQLEAAKVDRHAVVVVVGGGAFQDMTGYAAAIAHRGVRVARVPTTVLSQADSAVGVKNGVNAFGKKNFLGTFAPPFAVLIDPNFLRTLPARDAIAGMAEAIKVGLIKDAAFFHWMVDSAPLLARCDDEALAHLVHRCAELHLAHIATSGDAFEYGSARPLDFGHWSAHKLESLTAHRLSHGEAVAIGIALDTRYGVEIGMLAPQDGERIVSLIERLGLPIWDAALDRQGPRGLEILRGLEEFREHLGGELTVTLLDGIGRAREVHALDHAHIRSSLEWLRARAQRHDARVQASPNT